MVSRSPCSNGILARHPSSEPIFSAVRVYRQSCPADTPRRRSAYAAFGGGGGGGRSGWPEGVAEQALTGHSMATILPRGPQQGQGADHPQNKCYRNGALVLLGCGCVTRWRLAPGLHPPSFVSES